MVGFDRAFSFGRLGRFRSGAMLVAALAAILSARGMAEEAERERMKEPVYRVGTTAPAGEAVRPTPPRIDPALLDGETEAGKVRQVAAAEDAVQLPTKPAPPAAIETASVMPVRPPHEDPKTVKDPQLLRALDHTSKCLEHIEQNIHDYSCILIKREMVDGQVIGPDYIQTKVRHPVVKNGKVVKPFSVYMRFVKPTDKRGREVLYLHGVNDNKVLIREAGWKGKLAGAVSLARDSSLLMSENRHEVHEVGVLNLTHRILERGHARDGNIAGKDYTATYGEGAELNKRPCRYLDINFTTRNRYNDASKIRVMYDEELNIPVRYVAYGWPSAPGSRAPLLEEYTYINIKVNQGLTDSDFSPNNKKYGFY